MAQSPGVRRVCCNSDLLAAVLQTSFSGYYTAGVFERLAAISTEIGGSEADIARNGSFQSRCRGDRMWCVAAAAGLLEPGGDDGMLDEADGSDGDGSVLDGTGGGDRPCRQVAAGQLATSV
ncbi:BRCT domain-containing DNA repair protein [Striga asiatica]|uniref:BRCT domain-containing DNA repair protein n=1 Tax=Striga asiatica TaxID=4170 RepID=A0A5A7Q8D9_STRAF|nr:BRCT domain-containing DNA repair protein [Striga asiatica]